MKKLYRSFNILFTALFLVTISISAENKVDSKKEASDAAYYYDQAKKLYDQKQYDKAFPLMYKAAEMGHSDAQMHVGKMYYNGWGVVHSHEKGKEWHQKAAKQGNPESLKKLYNMEHGKGSAH